MSGHGGRWAEYLRKHGSMPLDFSASTSPLGMPRAAHEAAVEALRRCSLYPDPNCSSVRLSIARAYGVGADDVLVGNGAGDLIDRLAIALRPRSALVCAPTFSEYRVAFERVGCVVGEHRLEADRGFELDEGILGKVTRRLDVLVLCEPNNPTGRTCSDSLLARIARRCDETRTLLVVDECFGDFLDDGGSHSLLSRIGAHRVLVLRALTKFHGMAGLRLGWCACADGALLRRMAEAAQPWSVSLVAQEAGIAALADKDYERRLRELVGRERPRLVRALEGLGCDVVRGEANFLLFRDETPCLAERLEEVGILIRDCGDFSGLGDGWYRVAVRTEGENDRLVAAMGEVRR